MAAQSDAHPPQGLPPVDKNKGSGGDDQAAARMQAELNRTRQQLDQITQRLTQPPPQPPPPPGDAQKRELEREFLKSPLDMSTAIAQRAAMQVVGTAMGPAFDTMCEMAKSQARGSDPKQQAIFDKYEQEIVAQIMQVQDANMRTNVNVWKNAFNLVKGHHMDDIMRDAGQSPPPDPVRAPGVIIRQGQGPAPAREKPGPAPPGVALSDDEKKWAKRFRLTDEQYAQGKVYNSTQSDEYTDPVGKSSWDEFVTFDSLEARRRKRAAAKK